MALITHEFIAPATKPNLDGLRRSAAAVLTFVYTIGAVVAETRRMEREAAQRYPRLDW
jgi:hypothetical protein